MKSFNYFRLLSVCMTIMICVFILAPVSVLAEETIDLGSTENFAVLAGSTVTNTGPTVINGDAGSDVGVSPGSAVTGFPPGIIVDGTIHSNDAVAIQAQTDLVAAYNEAANRPGAIDLSGQNLGGLTLTTGVYSFSSSADLTGPEPLILDAEGDPDAAFIFQIGSTLTTASSSEVVLINGAQYCRVFWQVGSSATLGTDSVFIGHIFAMASITATTGASVQGQLLAIEGAVTLDSNEITNGVCDEPTPTETEAPTSETEAPTSETAAPTSETAAPTSETAALTETAAPTETAASTQASAAAATDTVVPKTGEAGSYGFIGLILIVVAGGLGIYLKRIRVR